MSRTRVSVAVSKVAEPAAVKRTSHGEFVGVQFLKKRLATKIRLRKGRERKQNISYLQGAAQTTTNGDCNGRQSRTLTILAQLETSCQMANMGHELSAHVGQGEILPVQSQLLAKDSKSGVKSLQTGLLLVTPQQLKKMKSEALDPNNPETRNPL